MAKVVNFMLCIFSIIRNFFWIFRFFFFFKGVKDENLGMIIWSLQGFPGGSDSKEFDAMRETWVWLLGQEDPLKKEMETHSSILAWRIPQGYSPWGHKESDTTE